MAIRERSPEGVFDFWLGPMRSIEHATEDNWRNGMLKWRVGVFARGAEDAAFREAQREWCEQIHLEGIDEFFAGPEWETPKGILAKALVLDQFGRCVYRGTPVAYANDAITGPILQHICEQGWDLTEYNEIERMWVYVALSHPERRGLQELSVAKWTRWSAELVEASPKELRKTSQYVSWYFIKSIIEHAEAVLVFGRFPHRNPIMSRPHKAGEVFYLTDGMRPLWSFTQPPRPDYFAILGALCRLDEGLDVDAVPRECLARLQREAGIDENSEASLLDIYDRAGADELPYTVLYRHMRLTAKQPAFEALRALPLVADLTRQVEGVILKDPEEGWPPRSAKHSVPAVVAVPRLNEIVRCHSFSSGDLKVSLQAVRRLARDMGLRPISPEKLMAAFDDLRANEPRLFRDGPDGNPLTAQLGKKGFQMLASVLFDGNGNLEKVAQRLYDVIDMDYDHSITTAEALMGLSLFCPGSSAVRKRLAFDVFDVDRDEALNPEETHDMLRTVGLRGIHMIENLFDPYFDASDTGMAVTLEAVRHYNEIEEDAARAVAQADTDGDGRIRRAEFDEWVSQHAMMRQFIEVPNLLFEAVAA
ncbi:EF hand [Tsuneonella dongtanensis]|uniref:EF hand n=1 Tax=Tsuneonella dongtanensis TaxID=692370 RepID=A0A1B2ABC4_9SPHN|nr:DUF924 family protein [Tsuneonella dongtanensis]ANY19378.1 EF hand [Tsuneonella dongtanensis]